MPRTLAARYQRLLLGYPRRYRRARGPEIIDTLLELAPPERTRPTVREAANLIGHGLRTRLGRPAGRAVLAWALATTAVGALFAASLGSWIGWHAARPLSTATEAAALFTAVTGSPVDPSTVEASPDLFVFYGGPLRWRDVPAILAPDGGEYQQGTATTTATVRADPSLLRAQGWQVSGATATRGDDVLLFDTSYGIKLTRATPWEAKAAAVAGGVLGAIAAYLLFGWASRRTDGRGLPLRTATTTLYGLTTLLWWLPIVASTVWPGEDPRPLWEWLGQPSGAGLFAVGAVAALLALGLAALPGSAAAARHRPMPAPTKPGSSPGCG